MLLSGDTIRSLFNSYLQNSSQKTSQKSSFMPQVQEVPETQGSVTMPTLLDKNTLSVLQQMLTSGKTNYQQQARDAAKKAILLSLGGLAAGGLAQLLGADPYIAAGIAGGISRGANIYLQNQLKLAQQAKLEQQKLRNKVFFTLLEKELDLKAHILEKEFDKKQDAEILRNIAQNWHKFMEANGWNWDPSTPFKLSLIAASSGATPTIMNVINNTLSKNVETFKTLSLLPGEKLAKLNEALEHGAKAKYYESYASLRGAQTEKTRAETKKIEKETENIGKPKSSKTPQINMRQIIKDAIKDAQNDPRWIELDEQERNELINEYIQRRLHWYQKYNLLPSNFTNLSNNSTSTSIQPVVTNKPRITAKGLLNLLQP